MHKKVVERAKKIVDIARGKGELWMEGLEDNWDKAREVLTEKAKQILITKKGIPLPTDAQIKEQKRQMWLDTLSFDDR